MAKGLSLRFYQRPCPDVARALLGKKLWHRGRAGYIVETEAYLGPEDLASHARFGPAGRSQLMFGRAGVAYVYLIYGMYHCFNVVTGDDGAAQAVLVRALEPATGLEADMALARGPGKLARALDVTRRQNGIDLAASDDLFIGRGRAVADADVRTGPRVGVAYAGTWAKEPLRYWIADHPAVSRARG